MTELNREPKGLCLDCPFFEAVSDATWGNCKRSNPQVISSVTENEHGVRFPQIESLWPAVNNHDWCGEHPANKIKPKMFSPSTFVKGVIAGLTKKSAIAGLLYFWAS